MIVIAAHSRTWHPLSPTTAKPALLYESFKLAERNACVELKEGGTEISATEENTAECIQLLVEHRVVEPQITALALVCLWLHS